MSKSYFYSFCDQINPLASQGLSEAAGNQVDLLATKADLFDQNQAESSSYSNHFYFRSDRTEDGGIKLHVHRPLNKVKASL